MLPNDQKTRFEIALDLVGDEDAAVLLVLVGDLARLADNIADGDSIDPQRDMAQLLILAVHRIPTNAFFLRHAEVLRHSLAAVATGWDVSNRFHRTDDARKHAFGFVHREADDMFLTQVGALCLGWNRAADVYEALFAVAYGKETETLEDWVKEGR